MSAPDARVQTPAPARTPWWLVLVWGLLALVLVALLVMAGRLFFTSGLFGDGPVTPAESKNVWTFLGVSLGAVVTLIGTLLTFQHQQRTTELAREQQSLEAIRHLDEQQRERERGTLERQAERRLQVDTAAQMLAYLTREDGTYAEPAVVAGAVAAMMEVGGGTTGLRVLRRLWADGHVDAATVVPAIDRILLTADGRPDGGSGGGPVAGDDNALNRPLGHAEVYAAAELLALHADRVLPAPGDRHQSWMNWPSVFERDGQSYWPSRLSVVTKNALLLFIVRALAARDAAWWSSVGAWEPINTLVVATADGEVSATASALLRRLDEIGFLGAVQFEYPDPEEDRRTIARGAEPFEGLAWFTTEMDAIGVPTGSDQGRTGTEARSPAPPAAPKPPPDPSAPGPEQHPGVSGQA